MIVPSIDVMGGRAVQLRQGRALELDAGDPRPLAERFGVCGEIAVIDLDAALGRGDNRDVIRELLALAPCRVGGGIRSAEAALDWLDSGARRVILGTAARPDVLERLPSDRVLAALDARDGDVVVEGWTRRTGRGVRERMTELAGLAGGFLVTFVEVEGTLEGLPVERVPDLVDSAGEARVTFAGGIRSAEEIARLDRLGADAQVGMALYSGLLDLADAFAAPLVSERPDGLWPTIVEDAAGRVLGLAWSDGESLRAALAERRGVYRSRTRGLWRKGETSGATQELVRVSVDCDRDTLRFTVRQRGAGFCHTGAAGCFDAPGAGPTGGRFADLADRIAARLADPPAGSLTARLAREPALLEGKLVEEAGELAAARDADDAVREFADLLYFGLTRLLVAGGTPGRVRAELDRRALRVRRRPPRAPATRGGPGPSEPLPDLDPDEAVRRVRRALGDPETERIARRIVEDVRARGEVAVREHGERLGDLEPGAPLLRPAAELGAALARLDDAARARLERAAERIARFARAQRETAVDLEVRVPGGWAGHRLLPVSAAGCYVPGGRHPLPSTALMTVIPARVAGVRDVWIASPRPGPELLAAAGVAGAGGVLAVGGAQAVAALAFGLPGLPRCEVVAGPGNRFVTAAKRALYGEVGLDTLAGPSELLVLAGPDCDADRVAADLIAQAEHDPDAVPLLCTWSAGTAAAVRDAVRGRLGGLPTAETARRALARGGVVRVTDPENARRLSDAVGAEHVQLHGPEAERLAPRLAAYGALFIGERTPEVAGDYGVGPNHTLPTGGTAGFSSGLSVFSFLRRPTWVELDPSDPAYDDLLRDAAELATVEGLAGHARAAETRLVDRGPRRA